MHSPRPSQGKLATSLRLSAAILAIVYFLTLLVFFSVGMLFFDSPKGNPIIVILFFLTLLVHFGSIFGAAIYWKSQAWKRFRRALPWISEIGVIASALVWNWKVDWSDIQALGLLVIPFLFFEAWNAVSRDKDASI